MFEKNEFKRNKVYFSNIFKLKNKSRKIKNFFCLFKKPTKLSISHISFYQWFFFFFLIKALLVVSIGKILSYLKKKKIGNYQVLNNKSIALNKKKGSKFFESTTF